MATCLNGVPCPGTTPICDSRGVCVQCTSNTDCASMTKKPNCNTANGECVECARSSQCARATPRCDPVGNTCGKCLSDADCTGEWHTCASSGACVDT